MITTYEDVKNCKKNIHLIMRNGTILLCLEGELYTIWAEV